MCVVSGGHSKPAVRCALITRVSCVLGWLCGPLSPHSYTHPTKRNGRPHHTITKPIYKNDIITIYSPIDHSLAYITYMVVVEHNVVSAECDKNSNSSVFGSKNTQKESPQENCHTPHNRGTNQHQRTTIKKERSCQQSQQSASSQPVESLLFSPLTLLIFACHSHSHRHITVIDTSQSWASFPARHRTSTARSFLLACTSTTCTPSASGE